MKIHAKDPGSAITHGIGAVLALCAAVPLIYKASLTMEPLHIISIVVFICSMVALYTASTLYHTLDISDKVNKALKKMDHMMIFILIAGTYTPICLIAIGGSTGTWLLAVVWGIAALGILFKAFWINCPKWVSSVLYIGMGWTCLLAFPQILSRMSGAPFFWLLAGGVLYTVGGVIYALKLPVFNNLHKNFGSHEIFHCFVLAGSVCHFIVVYCYLTVMPL